MPHADRHWLEQLFDDGGQRFLGYLALRLKDGTGADDLAQEVYLRLLRVDDVHLIRDPRSFALKVATNIANEWSRLSRHRREHLSDEALQDRPSDSADPLEQAAHAQAARAVIRAMEGMSSKRRAILLFHVRDGLPYAQIASQVGLSVSMVRKHLALALATCQEALQR